MVNFISQPLIVTIPTRRKGNEEGRFGVKLPIQWVCKLGSLQFEEAREVQVSSPGLQVLVLAAAEKGQSTLPSAHMMYHNRHHLIFYKQLFIPPTISTNRSKEQTPPHILQPTNLPPSIIDRTTEQTPSHTLQSDDSVHLDEEFPFETSDAKGGARAAFWHEQTDNANAEIVWMISEGGSVKMIVGGQAKTIPGLQ
eukprot:9373082-Ditylum_brightwellii.AAC.1